MHEIPPFGCVWFPPQGGAAEEKTCLHFRRSNRMTLPRQDIRRRRSGLPLMAKKQETTMVSCFSRSLFCFVMLDKITLRVPDKGGARRAFYC